MLGQIPLLPCGKLPSQGAKRQPRQIGAKPVGCVLDLHEQNGLVVCSAGLRTHGSCHMEPRQNSAPCFHPFGIRDAAARRHWISSTEELKLPPTRFRRLDSRLSRTQRRFSKSHFRLFLESALQSILQLRICQERCRQPVAWDYPAESISPHCSLPPAVSCMHSNEVGQEVSTSPRCGTLSLSLGFWRFHKAKASELSSH